MRALFRLRHLAAATGGSSAVEFALVAAFLVLPLTLGVYDFGSALYDDLQVGTAARAGAQYINVNGYSSTYNTSTLACTQNNFTCAIQSATNLGGNITVSVANPYCGCQSGSTYSAAAFSPPCNVCNSTYTSGCCPSGQTPVTLAQVNASYTYTPIFSYFGFGPSNGFQLSNSATALLY
jgi:Flp pilus assembly protein TadG